MKDLQIAFREDATSVALIVANGEFWLWFTTEPGRRLRPQIISRDQLEELTTNHFSDAEAKAYLETRMQAAGYTLQRSAIQSEDISVWKIGPG
jgi:hypothetical protein